VLTSYGQSLSHFFFSSAGECWPGPVVFPDFTQSKVWTWWAKLVKEFVGNDIDGIWNDMNELAVFKVTQILIPLPTSTSLLIVYISRKWHISTKSLIFSLCMAVDCQVLLHVVCANVVIKKRVAACG